MLQFGQVKVVVDLPVQAGVIGEPRRNPRHAVFQNVEGEAARIAEKFNTAENRNKPDAEWRFEVVDIRLIPVTHDVPSLAWMAYGTL